jgi:chromosome transmission fidelity protein 4
MPSDKISFDMDWHPSGKSIAVPSLSGVSLVTSSDNETWTVTDKLEEYKQEAFVVKWSPNGRYLASGHADSHVLLWDAHTKLSIDRSKCPELPLALQWNRSSNTMLICLANGRYAEWNGVIPKNLPDPIKPFDAASLAAQEYESQKQSLDNMFADEENVEKNTSTVATNTTTTNHPKPTNSVSATRTSSHQTGTSNSTSTKNKKTANYDDDDDAVDIYKRGSHFDVSSDVRSGGRMEIDHHDYDQDGYAGYGGDSYGRSRSTSIFDLQSAFMPSSTQGSGARRILVLNHIGSIVSRVEEYPTIQTSMEMDFSDVSVRKPFSLTSPFAVDLATLGEQGVLTSSRQQAAGRNRVTTNLQFNMFNKFGAKSDWGFRLDHGEYAVGLAVGDHWSAVATSQRRLRLFGEGGAKMAVLALPGPPISLCAHGPLLAVIYHSGVPLASNSLPKSFSELVDTGDGEGDDGNSQNIGWWIFHVGSKRLLSSGSPMPLSPGAQITWLGFSTEGALCTFDSKGILRQLAATTRYTLGSTPLVSVDSSQLMSSLVPSWSDIWFEILDTKSHTSEEDVIWPIAVTNEKLRYVKHSKGLDGPNVQPKPVPSYMALAMPFGPGPENAESHESTWIRSVVSMNAAIGSALDEKMRTEGPLGEEVENDQEKPRFLVDLASDKQILAAQAKLDGLVLKLLREASQDGRVERALGLAKTLVLKKSIQVAIQVASKTSQPQLADKIAEWSTRRDSERKRVNDASQRMIASPVQSHFSALSSLETHSMSLPQSFEANFSSIEQKRKHAGVKRSNPDIPSSNGRQNASNASKTYKETSKTQGNGSDDEFEVDDEEEEEEDDEEIGSPSAKKFATQAIEDDDDDDEKDDVKEDEENDMDVDDEPRGKDGSVFKSSPFAIAPPFQQGGGRLADTLSAISKPKKSSSAKSAKTTASSMAVSKLSGPFKSTKRK